MDTGGCMSACQQQRADLSRKRVAVAHEESFVPRLHMALSVDEKTRRHAVHSELLRQLSLRIEHDAKLRRVLAQEAFGIPTRVIDVDCNHYEPFRSELGLQAVHPGKRLAARSAPGSPEVEVYHLAAQRCEIERRLGAGLGA